MFRTGSKLGITVSNDSIFDERKTIKFVSFFLKPLMLASMNGHVGAVKLLLDMGADINAQIETNRNTALTLACFQGRAEVVSLLVDRKGNIEHRAKTGLTPLMESGKIFRDLYEEKEFLILICIASGGYVDVGRVLLERGADVNATPVPTSKDTGMSRNILMNGLKLNRIFSIDHCGRQRPS
jgi:hypothetical protein